MTDICEQGMQNRMVMLAMSRLTAVPMHSAVPLPASTLLKPCHPA